MKRASILFLLVCIFKISFGQNIKIERKVVQLFSQQSFYLNSGTHLGGKTREYLTVNLPNNTVEWYYVFSTKQDQNQNSSIGLYAQLTRLIDPTGLSSIVVSKILAPTGSGVCDIYLFQDLQNLNKFINKADKFGQQITSINSGTRENFKDGVVEINNYTSGTYYLGFKNPSSGSGVNITVEADAIVEDTLIIRKTDSEEKAGIWMELSQAAYKQGDFVKSLNYCKKALNLDSHNANIEFSMGLVYLVTDNDSCIDAYVDGIDLSKKSENPKQDLSAAIKDINDAEAKSGALKNSNVIVELLKSELKNY